VNPTRRTFATAAVAALTVWSLASVSDAATGRDAPGQVSPRLAERLYTACIDGAPTTPDSRERWVAGCLERAADGLG
jgi:hypothetical protein